MEAQPLIVIVGPTASGKTSLAVSVAKKFNCEIICADSRTVYKGMDIGTAKPTAAEQSNVKHWGLDIVEPNQRFTVADFKKYTTKKIADIRARGRVPLLVGGSGLYVDAVIFDYQFGPDFDKFLRQSLESMNLEQLQEYCVKNNIKLPQNHKNKRHLVRAIEQKGVNKQRREKPIQNCNIVGISTNTDVLKQRIIKRSEQLFKDGVIEEARKLGDMYGWGYESMTGNIYPLCKQYINGEISLQQMQERFITLDWKLAKRQLTWFKRNEYINWFNLKDAEEYIVSLFESEH